MTWVSWATYYFFVAQLGMEHFLYWHFVTFQKKYPQNQLDAKKSEYQAKEK